MEIYLGGGKNPSELYDAFAKILDPTEPLLCIPVAMNKEYYSESFNYISREFNQRGLEKLTMWVEADLEKATGKDFSKFSGIYVSGGNTFKLFRNFLGVGIIPILDELLKAGMPYCGNSAGALIPCRSIVAAIASDEEEFDPSEIKTLDLVDGWDIFPHYQEGKDERIEAYIKKFSLKRVLGVPENSGLRYDGDSFIPFGKDACYSFEEGSKKRI